MTRAKIKAEARMTRAKIKAEARMTRVGTNANAHMKAGADARPHRRAASSVRLQICANVFARSRIHFDATRWAPALAAASDVATAPARACEGAEEARPAPTPLDRTDEFTLH